MQLLRGGSACGPDGRGAATHSAFFGNVGSGRAGYTSIPGGSARLGGSVVYPAGAVPVVHAGRDSDDACVELCAAGGCIGSGRGMMSFVGPGRGDYVTESTYRYVGLGAGNMTVHTPRNILWGRILVGVVALALLSAAVLAVMSAMLTTTTTTLAQLELPPLQHATPLPLEAPKLKGECTLWGDPHYKTFDGGRPSFYGEGEYYIIKADGIRIQGRYMGTRYTAGLAATRKVAVGGDFIEGHVIAVGALEEGPVTVDGVPVLEEFPSSYDLRLQGGSGVIKYTAEGRLVDDAASVWEKRVVHMELPRGVYLEVFRWKNYLDLRIEMPPQPNQDGSCGNFNGRASDDTTEAIFSRIGSRVPRGELLFNERVEEVLTDVEEHLLTMCDRSLLAEAQAKCPGLLASYKRHPTTVELKSCMLDLCYGSNQHTLAMAKSFGLVPGVHD